MNNILLADDEKNIALTLKKRLSRAGYSVSVTSDGVETLNSCLEEDWALVLLDLRLPKMDGFMVLEALEKENRLADLPIVIVSASSNEDDIEKAKKMGARDYLIKPIESEDLLESVEKYKKEDTNE